MALPMVCTVRFECGRSVFVKHHKAILAIDSDPNALEPIRGSEHRRKFGKYAVDFAGSETDHTVSRAVLDPVILLYKSPQHSSLDRLPTLAVVKQEVALAIHHAPVERILQIDANPPR